MYNMSFEELLEINCFSDNLADKQFAAELLERYYACEIFCPDMDKSVLFAHHGRGCTIVAAKICKGVVIYQNVTFGSNMKYNRLTAKWENVGSPILAENVIVCDGAKIFGPVVIGKNTVVGAGAIVTKDIPPDCVVYGVNEIMPKNQNYDLVFNSKMLSGEEIMEIDRSRAAEFVKSNL